VGSGQPAAKPQKPFIMTCPAFERLVGELVVIYHDHMSNLAPGKLLGFEEFLCLYASTSAQGPMTTSLIPEKGLHIRSSAQLLRCLAANKRSYKFHAASRFLSCLCEEGANPFVVEASVTVFAAVRQCTSPLQGAAEAEIRDAMRGLCRRYIGSHYACARVLEIILREHVVGDVGGTFQWELALSLYPAGQLLAKDLARGQSEAQAIQREEEEMQRRIEEERRQTERSIRLLKEEAFPERRKEFDLRRVAPSLFEPLELPEPPAPDPARSPNRSANSVSPAVLSMTDQPTSNPALQVDKSGIEPLLLASAEMQEFNIAPDSPRRRARERGVTFNTTVSVCNYVFDPDERGPHGEDALDDSCANVLMLLRGLEEGDEGEEGGGNAY